MLESVSTRQRSALERAIDRDMRDIERLDYIEVLIAETLDKLIPDLAPLEHPRRRWSPYELHDALIEQLHSLRLERHHYTGSVMVEDDDDGSC